MATEESSDLQEMANDDEAISDKLIADVAESIGVGDLEQVGLALGIPRPEILRHEATNFMSGRVTCRGTRDMLREWRSKTLGRVIELQRALEKAGVKFDFGRPELPRSPSPNGDETATLSESRFEVTDVLIDNLAKNIASGEDFDALGLALGCSQAEISRYLATNSSFGRMTYKGTKDMLYAWRSRTSNADAVKLKRALVDAQLVSFADNFFRDVPPLDNSPTVPHHDFLDTKVTDALTVRDLRRRLEDTYEHEHCHVQLVPWSEEAYVKLNDLYINIAVFKEGNKFVPGRSKKRVKLDSINDVFRKKFDGSLPMRIVVLAKAGTGKTTMVAKIAYDWKNAVEGSPLKDFPLLFVITMRRLKKDTSLGEAILFQLLQSMSDISGEELEKFIAANEDKCMLVLDGYDEYVGRICTKSSQGPHLCSSVIDVMCNRKLRKCRTLVTSRFYRETDFNKPKFAFVKMTVEGFSDANISEYVTQFFREEYPMGEELQKFLKSNPLITELIHVPLFCVMLCDLWQQNSLEDVSTRAGLFDQVNLFLWHHSRRSDDDDDDDALDDDDNGSRLDELILNLGRIAFESLLEDRKKIVFSESDFIDVKDDLEMGRKIGLVSKRTVTARQIKRGAPTSTTEIQFYHKLAQEHCASKYLAQLVSEPNAMEDALKRMGGKPGVLVYENLLRFTCGESATACAKVLKHIYSQEWLLPPDVNFLFRVTLDLLHECQEVNSEVASQLETIFNRGYLCLHGLPSSIISALHKLPMTVRNKIKLVRVQSMKLPDESIGGFAEIVKQFGGLVHLGFRGVQMQESSMTKIVTATRHIKSSKGIMFKYCKTRTDGELDSFARSIHVKQRENNLRVLIFHAKEDQDHIVQDDVKSDFHCTHFGQ